MSLNQAIQIRQAIELNGQSFSDFLLEDGNMQYMIDLIVGGSGGDFGGEMEELPPEVLEEIGQVTQQDSSSDGTNLIGNSGRFYLYSSKPWVTDSDDNYGPSYFQFNEQAGKNQDPVVEWEHMGIVVPKGKTVRKLNFACRANATDVTDVELSIIAKRPVNGWKSDFDNDSEVVKEEIFRGTFVDDETAGNMADLRMQTFEIDAKLEEDSMISIYLRGVGSFRSTRYLRATWSWEIS